MNIDQLRNTAEYARCMNKIRSYKSGFEFTLQYDEIPRKTGNALRIIMRDACNAGLIEMLATDISIDCEITAETYRRM